MIDEDEVEAALRRYRTGEPPPGLADRVAAVESAASDGTVEWLWGPAAAAAVLTAWIAGHMAAMEPPHDPARDAEVAFVAEVLGGGEDAIRYADLVVPRFGPDEAPPSTEPPW